MDPDLDLIPDLTPFLSYFKNAEKLFLSFSYNLPVSTFSSDFNLLI